MHLLSTQPELVKQYSVQLLVDDQLATNTTVFHRRSINNPFYIPMQHIQSAGRIPSNQHQQQLPKKHGNVKRGSSVIKYMRLIITFYDQEGLQHQQEAFQSTFGGSGARQRSETPASIHIPEENKFSDRNFKSHSGPPPLKKKRGNKTNAILDLCVSSEDNEIEMNQNDQNANESYANLFPFDQSNVFDAEKPSKIHIVRRRNVKPVIPQNLDPKLSAYVTYYLLDFTLYYLLDVHTEFLIHLMMINSKCNLH